MNAGAAAAPRRRTRVTGRAVLLAALVTLLLAAGIMPVRDYFEQRAEIETLENQVSLLERERNALVDRIERFRDPEYLEFLARKCLGMVKEGEIAFLSVPKGGHPRPPSC